MFHAIMGLKGNMFPLRISFGTLNWMNQRLSDAAIRSTYRELTTRERDVSGRRLCAELRARFGAVGKTERVFRIWREETSARARAEMAAEMPALPADVTELQRRLAAAELSAAENLARAERAEYREEAHQEKWAMEVDRLRMEVRALRGGRIDDGGGGAVRVEW
jgi:hypothetical protein